MSLQLISKVQGIILQMGLIPPAHSSQKFKCSTYHMIFFFSKDHTIDINYEASLEKKHWNQTDIEYATLNNKTDLIRTAIDMELVDVNAWVNDTDICIDTCDGWNGGLGLNWDCSSSFEPGSCGGSHWLEFALWALVYRNAPLDVARFLIINGANVNATTNFSVHEKEPWYTRFNNDYVKPIHIAALISDDTVSVIDLLDLKGADINATGRDGK